MKRSSTCWRGAAALLLVLWWVPRLHPAETVINGGFETEDSMHWEETGELPSHHRGVALFDVTGNGLKSWSYYQHPNSDNVSGLAQMVHLFAGVTYTVSADICYHNG